MVGNTIVLQRPRVDYIPSNRSGNTFGTASRTTTRPGVAEEPAEAEAYLRRSYALIQQLRHAVAERTAAHR